nr:substrate binding domain-containing protein [Pseudomonas syringae]
MGQCASVVCASPAYLAVHGTPSRPQELSAHNCLTYSYFGKSLWEFTRQQMPLSVPVGGNLSANDSVVLLEAAVAGAGVSLQPVHSAAPLMASGKLIALMPEYQPRALGIHAIYTSRHHQSATLRTFLDFLTEWFERGGD